MAPRLRKAALTVHVATSVRWLGAVLVFLVLALIGLTAPNEQAARGTYLVMEPAAWYVLVPLALASLLSGIVQSLGTHWGLVRHHWVLVKLVLTAAATGVLLMYMETFRVMAEAAGDSSVGIAQVRNFSPVLHAALALLVLGLVLVLAVFKPRGVTRYGARRQGERRVRVTG
ncbi:hypothetical protein [Streptomyces goshikiensis]|uniref:hypothetical protein n=1 Tax=Streptomyces goshikiensis TaxID=1942 RepID=UPI0036C08BCE